MMGTFEYAALCEKLACVSRILLERQQERGRSEM